MVMFLLMMVQKFNLVVCFSVLEYKFRVITACFMKGLLHAAFLATCTYRNALLLNHQSIMDFTTYSLVFFQSLTAYLGQYNSKYTTLLAFKPTGWTHSKAHINMGSIKPLCRGPVTIYGKNMGID